MKRSTEYTVEEIYHDMMTSEHLPTRVDELGDAVPTSDADRVEAQAEIAAIGQHPDKIRTRCIGCGDMHPILTTVLCECGGMVCQACAESEDDGVCEHDVLSAADAVDLLDAAARAEARTLQARWEGFFQQVILKGGPPMHTEGEMAAQATFYAGAHSVITLLLQSFDEGPEGTKATMQSIHEELAAFFKKTREMVKTDGGTVQ